MEELLLFWTLTKLTMGKLCRQLGLMAGLVLLCVLLPALAGRGAESALTEGVDFSPIVLAAAGPEGDDTAQTLERYMSSMADVRQYCQMEAMSQEAALSALERGDVTAALLLPEDMIRRIQRGEDVDLELVVDGSRPLESALTYWVGRSAADLLASVQSGIYAVLERYDASPPAGLDRDRVVGEINLRYVQWTLGRQDLFRTETLLPTQSLPIALHYGLSLFFFLILSAAPLCAWCFQGSWPASQRRLLYVRRSPLPGFLAGALSCAVLMAAASLIGLTALAGERLPGTVGTALLCGLFFAAHASFWGTVTRSAAGCGGAALLADLSLLALAGGIVPPSLMMPALARLGALSPIGWMRSLAAAGRGYPVQGRPVLCLLGLSASLLICAGALYARRVRGGEDPS